jgi:hypothetical protein
MVFTLHVFRLVSHLQWELSSIVFLSFTGCFLLEFLCVGFWSWYLVRWIGLRGWAAYWRFFVILVKFAGFVFKAKEYDGYRGFLLSSGCSRCVGRRSDRDAETRLVCLIRVCFLLLTAGKGRVRSRIYRTYGRSVADALPLPSRMHGMGPSAIFVRFFTGQKFFDNCRVDVPAAAAIEDSADLPLLPDLRHRKSVLQANASWKHN